MVKVFVYGTLMRGERAAQMLEGATYLGDYILDGYAMYDLGAFPGIKEAPNGRVYGELYDVPESLIPRMDEYEGEGELYERIVVSVRNQANHYEKTFVYVYLGEVSASPVQKKWNEYRREEVGMGNIYNIVKKHIDRYDFYDLLAFGAPEDEYDNESRQISEHISCDSTTEEIAEAIYAIMHRTLGDVSERGMIG